MPELILKFNLPEENAEAEIASNASNLFNVIWEFREELRRKIKYEEHLDKELATLEELEKNFSDLLEDNKVSQLFY